MEMLLLSLFAAWLSMRYIAGDAVAAVRGTESARTRDRRAREQLATDRAAAGRGPTPGQALADRIAHRIANPPEKGPRGPARTALALWWQDVWAEADRRRRERAAGRKRTDGPAPWPPRPSPPPPPDPAADVDDGVIDAEVVEDEQPDVDTGPTDEDYVGPPDPSPQPDPEPVRLVKTPQPDAPEHPGATVHPIRGDLTMPDTPNGETLDPTAASAFVAACKATADGLVASIDQSIASLRERGVAGAPLDHLTQMQESFTVAAGHASDADVYFQDHVGKAADLAADDTVTGTVEGTYLGAGNA